MTAEGLPYRVDGRRMFEGKTALVIGASRGIGAATAAALIRDGARVVLAARDGTSLEAFAANLRDHGGDVLTKPADAGDEDAVAALVAFAVDAFGRLDVAVNNAAMALPQARIEDTELSDYDRLMRVNARGVFAAMQHELRAMREGGGGAIVNVSSVGGLIGSTGRASYVASKHALGGITKSAALEYARDNIRVNAVAPGITMTDLIKPGLAADPQMYERLVAAVPMGRIADPKEIAEAILWLASDLASFVTGVVLPVDGGFTVP